MSTAYTAEVLTPVKGRTLAQFLEANGLKDKLDVVALFNWGTKDKAQIARALVELVGCSAVDAADPLKSVLDPDRGTVKTIKKPVAWAPSLDLGKVHTVKVKKRLAATAVAITDLTAFFDPASAQCTVKCRFEGDAARANKRELEVHATGYYEARKDRDGKVVESECGTDGRETVANTHIVRKKKEGVAPGDETITWDGTSDATYGILKNPAKISSSCAPYLAVVRYYKDDADKDTRIKLRPFYPRWKVVSKGKREVDVESLVVSWDVQGDPAAKLKVGQLAVVDKTGAVAFFVALDRTALLAKKYDLAGGAVKWDPKTIDPAKMPYRVQIQAHSDLDEDSGLAVAAMFTQVPVYQYTKVQMVAFNAKPDTHPSGTKYLGDSDPAADIETRCKAMIEAIQKAKPSVDTATDVLKVFVGPEFYFRGDAGAYPVEDISTIVPRMRVETDKLEYKDWLFVFGTAIGAEKHEESPGEKTSHGLALHGVLVETVEPSTHKLSLRCWTQPKVGWPVAQGAETALITAAGVMGSDKDPVDGSMACEITVDDSTGFVAGPDAGLIEPEMRILAVASATTSWSAPATRIKVASDICARIPFDRASKWAVMVGGAYWEAMSGGKKGQVLEVDMETDPGFYWLKVFPADTYTVGAIFGLAEPISTEVTNVALIQKGWSAPHIGDGSLRQVLVDKEFVSPIDFIRGAGITGGEFIGKWGEKKKAIIDGETRGVLPTTGSTDVSGASPNVKRNLSAPTAIGRAVGSEINLSGIGGGSVFTIDGITFAVEVCLDHAKQRVWSFYHGPNKTAAAGDPKIQVHLVPSWGMSIAGGDYGTHRVLEPNGVIFNVDGARVDSVARLEDGTYSCDDHPEQTGASGGKCTKPTPAVNQGGKVWWRCGTCKESNGNPKYYLTTPCPTHGAKCDKRFAALGSNIAPTTGKIDVPSTGDTKYFSRPGYVLVYPPKALPACDILT